MDQIVCFLSAFARHQAAGTTDFPGGFAARNGAYARSQDNNQLIVDGETEPGLLAACADTLLDGLGHRRSPCCPRPPRGPVRPCWPRPGMTAASSW